LRRSLFILRPQAFAAWLPFFSTARPRFADRRTRFTALFAALVRLLLRFFALRRPPREPAIFACIAGVELPNAVVIPVGRIPMIDLMKLACEWRACAVSRNSASY
jgi:hypothetical protein